MLAGSGSPVDHYNIFLKLGLSDKQKSDLIE
jgi:hypothetical protein